ncbi:kinase-like protein [Trametes coccinea BRFM310]|uniref:Kinase-like protein n=1 Tax=Trametes coccinea (strain BRFM310) TaxID=1353009 RepID=A0A1Y2IA17_TRAC3|nr:kinase-like protein [Trametes coccinea BRFM310]
MSAQASPRRLPHYVFADDEHVERYRRSTLKGDYDLIPSENFWKDRQQFLFDHGYTLRPRYWPDWRPSWLETNMHPIYCEDSIMLLVIDARRRDTNELVAIKKFRRDSQELHVARYLSSIRHPHNHTVPIHEVLDDPHDSGLALMVMPYLRLCNDPDFNTIGEVIDFINQTLEGLAFMHRHRIAHRDIAVENIMMDATALYPDGHHPVRIDYSPDGIHPVSPRPRSEHRVQYYYIDFGIACHFPNGASPLVVGDVGRDATVPELSSDIPYDAFKVDIYALGNLYAKQFEEYKDMQFMVPLIQRMKQPRPQDRPPAEDILVQWENIRNSQPKNSYRWRLSPKSEPAIGRMLNDTVAVAWEGINHLKKYVK